MKIFAPLAGLVLGLAACFGPPSLAADFPKAVTVYIGTNTGGGYDAYGRLVARNLSRFLPGRPAVSVSNMPGASGLALTNWMFAIAPRDGSAIGLASNHNAYAPLLGMKQARFNPREFNWIGSMGRMTDVVAVWHATPHQSVDAMFKSQITLSTTSGGDGAIIPNLLNELIGTRFKVVTGYPDSANAFLAVQRGEVDGTVDMALESLEATQGDLLKAGKLRILMQVALHPSPRLKDVPFVMDFVKEDDNREILKLLLAKLEYGRPFMAPPGVPADIVEQHRSAFKVMSADPQFLAEASRERIDIAFGAGADIQSLVDQFYATPAAIVAASREALKRAGQAGMD